MYSISTSTLKISYYPEIEFLSPKTLLPLFVVLNTLENHCNDWDRQRLGIVLLYQAFFRTSEIQVENEDDERLCHAFVDNFNAMYAPSDPNYRNANANRTMFDETLKSALVLVERMRATRIVLDPPRHGLRS